MLAGNKNGSAANINALPHTRARGHTQTHTSINISSIIHCIQMRGILVGCVFVHFDLQNIRKVGNFRSRLSGEIFCDTMS